MKAQALTLALSALALLSTSAVNAQCCNSVMSSPAVYAAPACGVDACAPLFGRHTFADNGVDYRGGGLLSGLFGGLLGFGTEAAGFAPYGYGVGYGPGWGYGSAIGYGGYGVNSLAAVVPNSCANPCARSGIAPICGQRLGNSMVDLRLFGFGFGFGRVNPRWDLRPAGEAI